MREVRRLDVRHHWSHVSRSRWSLVGIVCFHALVRCAVPLVLQQQQAAVAAVPQLLLLLPRGAAAERGCIAVRLRREAGDTEGPQAACAVAPRRRRPTDVE